VNKAVIFGAGKIGRSFIGNIFHSNNYKVSFVDANNTLVKELNLKKEYKIIIKRNEKTDQNIIVSDFTALHSSDTKNIIDCLVEGDICTTSVGKAALPSILPIISDAIKKRRELSLPPLDIIIAENIRNGSAYFKKLLKANGLSGDEAGLIETSIGKMVPIMTDKDLVKDSLAIHAEEYNTLILDKKGFKNPIPKLKEIITVENIAAWVDRKLFIHNLGHAASAYLGFAKFPERKQICEVLEDSQIRIQVRSSMLEAANGLIKEYPEEFTKPDLLNHIDELIYRFQNQALGDTLFRVGSDLSRKLSHDDRILGAARLCLKYDLPIQNILKVYSSALVFRPGDQNNVINKQDEIFINNLRRMGLEKALVKLCGLDQDVDKKLIKVILETVNTI
jgi:mannitol-1-phosphate 5-dehydrogenase